MSSRKALFFDVDGTLLDEKTRRIPESAVKAVQEARRQGHLAFVNSGRVSRLLDSVRDMIEMDGWLCGCGTYLIAGGRKLYARSIPHERGVEIRRLLKQHRIEGMLEGKGGCYLSEAVSWMPAIERSRRLIAAQGALSPLPLEDESYDMTNSAALLMKTVTRKVFSETCRQISTLSTGEIISGNASPKAIPRPR